MDSFSRDSRRRSDFLGCIKNTQVTMAYWIFTFGLNIACHKPEIITKTKKIEPTPRQAAKRVLPVTAVVLGTLRMKTDFQFARWPRRLRRGQRALSGLKVCAATAEIDVRPF